MIIKTQRIFTDKDKEKGKSKRDRRKNNNEAKKTENTQKEVKAEERKLTPEEMKKKAEQEANDTFYNEKLNKMKEDELAKLRGTDTLVGRAKNLVKKERKKIFGDKKLDSKPFKKLGVGALAVGGTAATVYGTKKVVDSIKDKKQNDRVRQRILKDVNNDNKKK